MIIGISGKIGSGKDTAGEMLRDITGYPIYKYADALKDCVCRIIGCSRETLEDREFKERPLGEEWRVHQNTFSGKIYLSGENISKTFHKTYILTPRLMLQLLGTEAGRQIIHPNIWVNATFAGFDPASDHMIITDMRFPNELKAVKDRGGITIRMERGDGSTGDHPSETALDDAKFDYVIKNNGTLEGLEDLLYKEVALPLLNKTTYGEF